MSSHQSIGLIEVSSIVAGFTVTDTMLKAANVNLILARSICSGKYMVLISGDVSSVKSAIQIGCLSARGFLIDHTVLPRIHPDVFAAIGRSQPTEPSGALGIFESFNIVTLIEAADAAVKTANVTILEVRLAMALGGKAFATVTGDVSSVKAAVDAGNKLISDAGVLVNAVVIPRPHKDVYREVL